ncbi:MAG: exodeoxyribonuclease VII small subunit [unclassified Hahellaceae]|nr:exodeoxyribonuclease VII small subunit [Hahellaceae bacterium]
MKLADFENTLQQLEGLVQKLERGDLSLDESLSVYEQGISLSRHCQQALQTAEQKVTLLSREAIAALQKSGDGKVPTPEEEAGR